MVIQCAYPTGFDCDDGKKGGGILKINRRGGANKLRGGARKCGKLMHGGARLFDTLEYI